MMMERRKFERFAIALPARMETVSPAKKQVFDLMTRDISSSGAFIDTESHFAEDLSIKLTITTHNERIAEITGFQSLIECEGTIVRSTETGVGICFNKECQILSLYD